MFGITRTILDLGASGSSVVSGRILASNYYPFIGESIDLAFNDPSTDFLLTIAGTAWASNQGWRSNVTLDEGEFAEFKVTTLSGSMLFGTASESSPISYPQMDCAFQYQSSTELVAWQDGSSSTITFALAINDIIRFTKVGSTIVASRGGVAFHTFTGVSTPQYAWAIAAANVTIGVRTNGSTKTATQSAVRRLTRSLLQSLMSIK
jgi:hypothetical protein